LTFRIWTPPLEWAARNPAAGAGVVEVRPRLAYS